MGATTDIQARLGIENVRVRFGDNNKQFITLTNPDGTETTVEMDVTATTEEIARALNVQKINKITEAPQMSITGALSLKAKFDAARARKAQLEARAESAVNVYNSAADIAESAIKSLEEDAVALQAEAAQFSNGAPV